jgi:hypothetical protein
MRGPRISASNPVIFISPILEMRLKEISLFPTKEHNITYASKLTQAKGDFPTLPCFCLKIFLIFLDLQQRKSFLT